MTLIALASIKGSPGVTTAATALAASWPEGRQVLLVEADPFGGDLAPRYAMAPTGGLSSLFAAARRTLAPEDVWDHVDHLPGGLPVLFGLGGMHQAVANEKAWPIVADALNALDADVVIDVGRLLPNLGGGVRDILARADALVVLCQSTLESIVHLREALPALAAELRGRSLLVVPTGAAQFSAADIGRTLAVEVLPPMPDDPGTASGLANTAASARLAAAVTFEDLLTTDARRAGGNGLRVPVMSIRATLSTGPGAASEILDRLQSDWPVASCDLPDPNDTTMAELYDSMEDRSAKRPVLVFAGGEGIGLLSETESDVDISELVDAGLVEMGTTARAQRVGGPDVPGWILRIAVRPDVAVALRKLWRVWDSARVKGGIPDAEALLLAYAGLTILTPLSFTYEAMVKAAGQRGAASPYLVDVVCTVHAGDRSASLAFFETETDSEDGAVDLMATLPLQGLPGKWNTDIEIRGGRRSPIVEGRSDPVARLLELRSFWRQGALSTTATRRANDLYKKLMKQLDGPAAAALTGERAAALERGEAGLKKDVHDTIAKMIDVETELVRSLGAAVAGVNAVPDPTTLEEIRRMVASLWKTRLFLKGAPEG